MCVIFMSVRETLNESKAIHVCTDIKNVFPRESPPSHSFIPTFLASLSLILKPIRTVSKFVLSEHVEADTRTGSVITNR